MRPGRSSGSVEAIASALAVLTFGACDSASTRPFAEPVYFSESDSAYVIGNVVDRLGGSGDDRIAFGSIIDVERLPSGWAVLDGINKHLVLVDGDLNPTRIVGGRGDGPGEFRAAWQLAVVGDTIVVFETGSGGKTSYFGPQGDFLRVSAHVPHAVYSFAIHPRLGRFFPILSRDHYLVRATDETDPQLVAQVPAAFVTEVEGSAGAMGLTPNLVAVTPDGTAHVLDDEHLAVVSYDPGDDASGRIAFLPREMRDWKLEERKRYDNVTWSRGYEELPSSTAGTMEAMPDGRIFISVRYRATQGYVLDPGTLTATPVVVTLDSFQMIARFDGRYLVLAGGLTPEFVLATTELVPRPSVGEGSR